MNQDRDDRPAWRAKFKPLRALLAICLLSVAYIPGHASEPQREGLSFAEATRQALAQGRLDEAEALAKEQRPDDPEAVAVRARVLIIRGRYQDAVTLLKPAAQAAPASSAALEYGLLEQMLGHKPEAEAALVGILDSLRTARRANVVFLAAVAARHLNQFQEANGFFRAALSGTPDDPEMNTAWGDLFLAKYNRPEAVKSYQTALAKDPKWTPALLGMARVTAEDNPPAARAAAERALAINSSLTGAHLLLAGLALDEGRRDEARKAIARAQEINPNSLEAHALVGAIAYLEDKQPEFEAAAQRALAINARYGEFYRMAGEHAAHNYRFDEAVVLVRKALELDPENTRAHADLGIHLLRTGDEPGAKAALDRAFKADPYDVVTYNLLSLFDSLEKFVTLTEGDITLRMHGEEANVLREYAMPLAQEALTSLSGRYGFKPQGPILIEIFPKHDDFAVRNVGLPGMIGALGACFGRVVTMDSPRARPPGSFNWGATLWHEMAHVVTLQMSKQRVPRWLTEGLSVYEEKRARPEWGRDMEMTFAHAMNTGEVLKLKDLNAGFTKPDTISLAYFEASLLVEHLIETQSEQAIHRLLRAYGEGLETDAALQKALNTDLDRIQVTFDEALEKKFGGLKRALQSPSNVPSGADKLATLKLLGAANPGSYPVLLALGEAQLAAGDTVNAAQTLERAAQLVPIATGEESARGMLIQIAIEKGDKPKAMRELETMLSYDHSDIESARKLAELAEGAGDDKRMWTAYERIVAIDPFDVGRHGAYGRLALRRGEPEVAQREFRAALAGAPVDMAGAHSDLAESYLASGRFTDARKHAMAALELAPMFERAQDLLLKIVDSGKP